MLPLFKIDPTMVPIALTSPPLKEGRQQPGPFGMALPKISARLRHTLTRFLALSIVIALVYWALSSSPDGPVDRELMKRARPRSTSHAEATGTTESTRDGEAPPVLSGGAPTHQHVIEADDDTGRLTATTPDSETKPSTHADAALEEALENVIRLLPDELTTRGLLSPIPGSGTERLREQGLRARSYKLFFEAWETLHLVLPPSTTTAARPPAPAAAVRDDIIQYLRAHPDFAASLTGSLAETIRRYEGYRAFLQRLAGLLFPWTAPYFADHAGLHGHLRGGGRGLVVTGGDGQAPWMLTSVSALRRLGCTLPVEVLYLGERDLGEDWRAALEALPGVVTRDVSRMVADAGWEVAGWGAKPFAVLLSSFREVVLVDADALFFRDPRALFDEPSYVRAGALFFRDRVIMPESKKQWLKDVLPHPVSRKATQSRYWTGVSGHMQESGVVVVDKWRHFIALLMVTRMNGPDRDGKIKDQALTGVYDMVYGDKETYWLGWELVGDLDYEFHQGDAGIIGTLQHPDHEEMPEEDNKATTDPDMAKGYGDRHPQDSEESLNATSTAPGAQTSPTARPKKKEPLQSYTVCAPQLLHLDTDGKPLWFNGWIMSNKFAEAKMQSGSRFEVYLAEPNDKVKRLDGERDPWQLKSNNEACLTTHEKFSFTPKEQDTLQMIIELAKEVGAYGK